MKKYNLFSQLIFFVFFFKILNASNLTNLQLGGFLKRQPVQDKTLINNLKSMTNKIRTAPLIGVVESQQQASSVAANSNSTTNNLTTNSFFSSQLQAPTSNQSFNQNFNLNQNDTSNSLIAPIFNNNNFSTLSNSNFNENNIQALNLSNLDSQPNSNSINSINNNALNKSQINSKPLPQKKQYLQQFCVQHDMKFFGSKAMQQFAQKAGFSILKGTAIDYDNYPDGAVLFEEEKRCAEYFDAFIGQFKKNKDLIKFVRKITANIYNEIYSYLLKILLNLNLIDQGMKQTNSAAQNVIEYLEFDSKFALTNKISIILYLIEIVETQFNGLVRDCTSGKMPVIAATTVGKSCIMNDFSVDLTLFLTQKLSANLATTKQLYLSALTSYLNFYNYFLSFITTNNKKSNLNDFLVLAENINKFLYSNSNLSSSENNENSFNILEANARKKMNPLQFFYTKEVLEAIKLVPTLAKKIPADSSKIGFSEKILTAATQQYVINGTPVAYLLDKNNKITASESEGSSLNIVTRQGKNFIANELIQEPAWLSNTSDIIAVCKACLGDFKSIIGMKIINPCVELILKDALGMEISQSEYLYCENYVKQLKNEKLS